jgi:hypothetical protein
MRKIYLLLLLIYCLKQNTHAQLFEKRYNWNLSTTQFAQVTAVEHRSNGNNLIALWQSYQTGQGAAALIEITPNGDTLWTKKFNRAGTTYGENYINFIKEMPDHSIFMAGGTHSSSGYYHAAVWKADSVGNITIYKQLAYNTYREITINDVDVANDGSIYFAGNYYDIFSGGVTFYSWNVPLYGKLNTDLTLAWGNTWGSTNHTNSNNNRGDAVGIKVAPDNNVIVLGYDAVDFNHGYNGTLQMAKLTPGGVIIWSKQRNLQINTYVKSLSIDNSGKIYVLTNYLQSMPGNNHKHTIEKFNNIGNLEWAKSIGTGSGDDIFKMKYNFIDNKLVCAGRNQDQMLNYMAMELTLDTAANPIQSKIFGAIGTNGNFFGDVTFFGNNYLFAGGAYTNGGMLVQTDGQGNTGCAANSINWQNANFTTNAFSSGIYHGGMNFTFTDYNANYISNPISSTLNCYACSDVLINTNVSACQSYFVGGALQVNSGVYYDTLAAAGGCDSIIVTNLTIYQNPTTANAGNNQNICNNAASINANTASIGTGTWSVISGGGNIVNVNDPTTGVNNLSLGDNILRWTTSNGSCVSSFDEVTIFVGTPSSSALNLTSCDSLTINNNTYYISGSYTQTLQNVAGCDSTISINLSIINSSNNIISESVCNTYTLNNQTYTQSGTYTQTVQNSEGCDSIITLNLIINHADTNLILTSTCNEDYVLNNQTYNTSGTYTQLLQTTAGCDSTIIIELTIYPAIDTTIIVSGITLTSNQLNAQYQWWNCTSNSIINNANNVDFTPIINGDYAVIINSNGCADTSACYGIYTVGINDNKSNLNTLEIIPNPNDGLFIINSNLMNVQLEIYNIEGAVVHQENSLQTRNTIDLQMLPAGMYFVTINYAEGIISKKIIINK